MVEIITGCSSGWHYDKGYCYYVSAYRLNHAEARRSCHDMHAELTSIANEDELQFIGNISYVLYSLCILCAVAMIAEHASAYALDLQSAMTYPLHEVTCVNFCTNFIGSRPKFPQLQLMPVTIFAYGKFSNMYQRPKSNRHFCHLFKRFLFSVSISVFCLLYNMADRT